MSEVYVNIKLHSTPRSEEFKLWMSPHFTVVSHFTYSPSHITGIALWSRLTPRDPLASPVLPSEGGWRRTVTSWPAQHVRLSRHRRDSPRKQGESFQKRRMSSGGGDGVMYLKHHQCHIPFSLNFVLTLNLRLYNGFISTIPLLVGECGKGVGMAVNGKNDRFNLDGFEEHSFGNPIMFWYSKTESSESLIVRRSSISHFWVLTFFFLFFNFLSGFCQPFRPRWKWIFTEVLFCWLKFRERTQETPSPTTGSYFAPHTCPPSSPSPNTRLLLPVHPCACVALTSS